MNYETGKRIAKAALAGTFALLATQAANGATSAQLTVRGYMPVLCKLDFSTAMVPPTTAGRVDLGNVREFCNTNNYRILVDYDSTVLEGSRLALGGDEVRLGNSGTDVVTYGTQPTVRTRPISLTLDNNLQSVTTISVRIEAAI